MFDVAEIKRRVESLKEFWEATKDRAHAHRVEDALWESVLIDISEFSTDPNAKAQAAEVLKSMEIDFDRNAI